MKRVAFVMLICILMSGVVFAQGETHAKYVYEYRIRNNAGGMLTTVVPTTSIRPGTDKLVGYRVIAISALSKEMCVGIYDSATSNLSAECLGEAESPAGYPDGELFGIPKQIANGVALQQGSYTQVILYFIRD